MIGIFDSGIGGLSVAEAIRRQSPDADILYFGDIANMPYGTKDLQTLERLTIQAMRLLRREGATHLVSACNSISATVVRPMLTLFGVKNADIVEMVGPTALSLASLRPQKVAVAATVATVASGIYQHHLAELGLEVKMIPCPHLAEAIEFEKSPETIQEEVCRAVHRAIELNCDVFVLGCTHYSLIRNVFENQIQDLNASITVFDPASAVAQDALSSYKIGGSGYSRFIISRDSYVFRSYVQRRFPSCQTEVLQECAPQKGMEVLSSFIPAQPAVTIL